MQRLMSKREKTRQQLCELPFFGAKSCIQHTNADDIEKWSWSLFVACVFVGGEVIDTKVDKQEGEDETITLQACLFWCKELHLMQQCQ